MSHFTDQVDLLVIGGGINGAGIARDAAGRGLTVMLCEQDDLAQHTSSASTKLIHGGLRYLEQGRLRLVREALAEREVLLAAAPHIVRPLRFVLPHESGQRPAWMLKLGLWLYDTLAGRKRLAATAKVNLRAAPHAGVLRDRLKLGFEYSDCWVDDARLVVLCALDAKERGAEILTRTRFVSAERLAGHWRATLEHADGRQSTVEARALVNAAGPWVGDVLTSLAPNSAGVAPRLVKGSHIVTRRLFDGDHAYIFQAADKRVIFAIPFERDFTLIGTTDIAHDGAPGAVEISPDETDYLCRAVSAYFAKPVRPEQVVWSYAGVRPLYDDDSADPSAVSRDYVLALDAPPDTAPLLSVLGGKITTSRKLAEQALDILSPMLGCTRGAWTADAPLPGGDMPNANFDSFKAKTRARYSWLPTEILDRLLRAYGTRIDDVLGKATCLDHLGHDFGAGLTEAELSYLTSHEWALTADDILWRRSKRGLHMTAEERKAVSARLTAEPTISELTS
jgi:glycerol-3-phosphate dehydrogenase